MKPAYKTTEITSYDISSDNVVNQRFFAAYRESVRYVSGDLLELGCGVGKGLEVFLPNCDSYTAIDKNKNITDYLQKKYPQANFINAFIPPFQGIADASMDTVISQQVIEHIEDDAAFVGEYARVMRPGAQGVIVTPNRAMSLTRNPWHVREYSAEELEALLRRYFSKVTLWGLFGSDRVMEYHEQNRHSVRRITRFDVLDLQHRLPRRLLQVPYDVLNRLNRKRLQAEAPELVRGVTDADFFLDRPTEQAFDWFCLVEK
ncbi:MAG: class I SAM-dependent methyltransferase [Bernardetiaceae bacterium]